MRAEWEAHTSRSGLLDAPTLRDGAIRLGAGTKIADVPDPCGEPPNIERVSALISAALGKVIDESGKSYLRGAFTALQKNLPPLAMTYFAHVGLGRLANPMEDAFRLHLADVLLKDGVAPSTIIDAVAEAALARSYNPNQPRVPAGNGDVSGQWVGGQDGAPQTAPTKAPTQGVQVADATDNWAQYLNPIGEAEAATSNRPQFNGSGPNLQHTAAVERAVAAYAARGFAIISDRAAAVSVPGFSSPRVYDFIARDPIDGFNFGVEVKTTLYDTIFSILPRWIRTSRFIRAAA